MPGTPSEALRKSFKAIYMGHEAEVTVDLGSAETAVRALGFTFVTQTDNQRIFESVKALVELERVYGIETEASDEQPGKKAMWVTKSGLVVRWLEACAVGARRYVVSYSNRGG